MCSNKRIVNGKCIYCRIAFRKVEQLNQFQGLLAVPVINLISTETVIDFKVELMIADS